MSIFQKAFELILIGLGPIICSNQQILLAQEIMSLPRLTETIQIDGRIDEPAWQTIDPLPLTMYQPTFQGKATEKSEIKVAYDQDYLYCSARFYDSDPSQIRTNSLYRDRYSGDDVFGIILDTFHDNENALWFWTTPAGIRGEDAISNDGGSINSSWNTYWDVAAIQNEEGWFAEIRIPFSSLGFQDNQGEVTMGLIVYRYISRKNERLTFPEISPDRGFFIPSRAKTIKLGQVFNQKPVYFTSYALGGLGQTSQLNAGGSAYQLNDDFTEDIGLDVKYNLTNNLTLDATVNTDFAQVEADDEQVNLSRFSLFFPERRQFFQERSGIFSFNTIAFGPDRLFHSRRIGINNGKEIPIIAGARVVGRIGNWDLGFVDMQTARKGVIPSENFAVLRMRRRVINPYSYAGIMATSRLDEKGNYNFAYGLDGIFRLFGDDYLTVKWAQTFDDDVIRQKPFDFAEAAMFQAQLNRRSSVGFNYWLTATRQGRDFFPGLGFATRQNFTELGWYLSYDWLMDERTVFRRLSPMQFFGFVVLRNRDQTIESALYEYDIDFQWKSGANISFDFEIHHEDLRDSLSFPSNSTVPLGSYTFFRHEGGFDMPSGSLFRTEFDWGLAQFYDGWRIDFGFGPTWNASRHIELNGEYELNIVRFPDRDQGFNAHVIRLRTQAALNTQVSLNAFLQYNSADDEVSANIRFRYNFREGNDLWFVYNENLNMDRNRETPSLLLTNDRTILVKYTYTFKL